MPDIVIKIASKDFKIKCPQEQVNDLHYCASFLNKKILDIAKGPVTPANFDNILATATLNIIQELISLKSNSDITNRLDILNKKIAELKQNKG